MNNTNEKVVGFKLNIKERLHIFDSQMDAILASTLINQINEVNKGEGDFKPQTYQAVVDKLSNELGKFIMMDHAKNRIKVLKKHHAIITDTQA